MFMMRGIWLCENLKNVQKKRTSNHGPLVTVKVQKKFKQIMLWLKTFDHNLCYPNKRFSPVNTFLLFEIITADISK